MPLESARSLDTTHQLSFLHSVALTRILVRAQEWPHIPSNVHERTFYSYQFPRSHKLTMLANDRWYLFLVSPLTSPMFVNDKSMFLFERFEECIVDGM